MVNLLMKYKNLLVGTDSDENEASKLVRNLGENVKVTGKIVWPKLENGKQEVLVEIGMRKEIKIQFLSKLTDFMMTV